MLEHCRRVANCPACMYGAPRPTPLSDGGLDAPGLPDRTRKRIANWLGRASLKRAWRPRFSVVV
jgi:hypothetical protein